MKTQDIKCLGVWMDHTEAWLIIPGEPVEKMKNIKSRFQGRVRIQGEDSDGTRLGNYRATNNEHHKHQQEKEELHAFFNSLVKELEPFTDILLFGPTGASTEFNHYLATLHAFQKKNISVRMTDYLTPNQLAEMVRKFFVVA